MHITVPPYSHTPVLDLLSASAFLSLVFISMKINQLFTQAYKISMCTIRCNCIPQDSQEHKKFFFFSMYTLQVAQVGIFYTFKWSNTVLVHKSPAGDGSACLWMWLLRLTAPDSQSWCCIQAWWKTGTSERCQIYWVIWKRHISNFAQLLITFILKHIDLHWQYWIP